MHSRGLLHGARRRSACSEAIGRCATTTVAAAQEVLGGEVGRLVSGEASQRFAAPAPSMVAGFRTWQSLGRHVVRGQRGYPILAPCRLRVCPDPGSPAGGVADEPGVEQPDRRRVVGFRVVHVFDVSRTGGAELPAPPAPLLLVGAAPVGLLDRVRALIEAEGFTVGPAPDAKALGGANGGTDWTTRRVLIRADMDEAARAKTPLQEAGHVLLHGSKPGRSLPRPVKEVEAESVAFVTDSACGLRSDFYSFPYVAAWAGADPAAVLAMTASRVAAAADRIVSELADLATPAARVLARTAAPVPEPAAEAAVEGIGW